MSKTKELYVSKGKRRGIRNSDKPGLAPCDYSDLTSNKI